MYNLYLIQLKFSVLDFFCCCRSRNSEQKTGPAEKNSKQLLLDKLFAVQDRNYEYLKKENDYYGGPVKGGFALLFSGYLAALVTRTPVIACYGACGAVALFSVGPVMKTIEKRQEIAEEEEKKKNHRKAFKN